MVRWFIWVVDWLIDWLVLCHILSDRRRIEKHTGVAGEPGALPETDKDRDFDRIMRVATNDDIAFLMKGGDPTQAAAKGVALDKKKVGNLCWLSVNK